MPLPDKNAGVVDGLGQPRLEDLGLQPPLEEVLNFQRQNVIESHSLLVQNSHTDQTTDEAEIFRKLRYKPSAITPCLVHTGEDARVALEQSFGVFLFELEELTSGTTDLGECQGDAPDFTLVAKTAVREDATVVSIPS